MANPNFATHGTLVDNVVTTVVLNGGQTVEVVNRTGTSEIFFNVGKDDAEQDLQIPAEPTVAGPDCFIVPAHIGSTIVDFEDGPVTVQLISSGAMAFSVMTGLPD